MATRKTKYVFEEGAVMAFNNASKAKPQIIGETLESIRAQSPRGELKPFSVVEAARPKNSALHPYFEWDDKKAAEAYRVDQARTIIRCISIVGEGGLMSTPAFFSIATNAGSAYHGAADVLTSASLQKLLLEQAREDLDAWQERYRQLQDLCKLVDQVKAHIDKKMKAA
jgi:hypothetical protein